MPPKVAIQGPRPVAATVPSDYPVRGADYRNRPQSAQHIAAVWYRQPRAGSKIASPRCQRR
ncbi:MAG: hypothetical protein DCC68_17020 [Planctomycetota bacterium]|nr:MAG: hypothetical protein DCC68_17020 [Planctomycetota bacterium]